MLYAAALASLSSARRALRAGDIRGRSCAITKAMRIVTELSRCLNREAGGDLSQNLANVYGYVLRLLIDGNVNQSQRPLAEAEHLLSTLAEAWTRCAPPQSESVSQQNDVGINQDLAARQMPQVAW